ncbi:MAG: DUF2905 domain-containing protein [Nitrospira sp. BO4]|jgi:hypothetical protein|nr:DUF2905 domain-containing protein [Nitrospira sp. BO4]
MPEWNTFGKILIGIGLGIVGLGVLLVLVDRIPGLGSAFSWLGKLPGDISVKRDNFSFYFPIGTSIVLSIFLSLLFYLLGWFFRR